MEYRPKKWPLAVMAAVLSSAAVVGLGISGSPGTPAAGAQPSPVTVVSGCNQTVTTNAVLANDLTCIQPSTGSLNGIIVGADGITIDLRNHTITAPPTFNVGAAQGVPTASLNGAGVLAIGHSNVTVQNGNLTGWLTAVRIRAIEANATATPPVAAVVSVDNTISKITVPDCAASTSTNPPTATTRAIDVAEPGADDNLISNVSVTGPHCSQGIRLHEAQGNTVKASTIQVGAATTTGDGIAIDCGGSNTLTGNNVASNNRYGILIGQADQNDIEKNTVAGNGSHGIFLGPPLSGECTPTTASHNTIAGNQVRSNGGNGIAVGPSTNATVTTANAGDNMLQDNAVLFNQLNGIALVDSDNSVTGNQITGNGNAGILVDTRSKSDALSRNMVVGNRANGIVVNGQGNVADSNRATSNQGDGIVVHGSATTPVDCNPGNCSNRIHANVANGNTGGGVVVAADNTDLGGNTGSRNGVRARNCIFGTVACRR